MSEPQPVRPACAYGGDAPCMDDLCHGSDVTMCGVDMFNDPFICPHGYIANCDECELEADDEMDWAFGPMETP